VWVVLVGFVVVRTAPQIGALTGVGPSLGAAPVFDVVTLDGDLLTPEDLAGKVVVVNFWATWCPPCRLEMPNFQELHERSGGEGVVVVGLSTDQGSDAPIRAFLAERGITYPVGRATDAHRAAFGGIPGIPTTFIIDRDGVLRHKVVGYFTGPALDAAVDRLRDDATVE